MRLGLNLGYQSASTTPADHLALAREADRLGYAVVWAAEAYGSDAPTRARLDRRADRADRHRRGGHADPGPHPGGDRDDRRHPGRVVRRPLPPRPGRLRPAGVRGLARRAVRQAAGPHPGVRRHRAPGHRPGTALRYDGEHWTLPLPDGPGKAVKLGFHPPRERIPIYLAAVGPKNLELAGEIADGWLAIFYAPDAHAEYLQHIERGRVRRQEGLLGFDVAPTVPVVIGDDLAACADLIRPYAALYVGGMGSREQNFYNQLAVRMGYPDAAAEVQDLYLDRKVAQAQAAVPQDFIERTSLIGNTIQITERIRQYAAAGVGTLNIAPHAASRDAGIATLRAVAEAYEASGVAE